MSPAGLFVVGVLVTLVVGVAILLLVYAAILDGRFEREHRERNREKVLALANDDSRPAPA